MLKRLYNAGLFCNIFYVRHRYIKEYKYINQHRHMMSNIARDKIGMPLKNIVEAIHEFADTSLAASWDNVGLLIEPTEPKNVSCILLTNDLTENVMDEAIKLKTDLIITYHPLIFTPLKSITTRSWKERIVARCLENKIAVFSPHTSFDSVKGGVNDWLAEAFELESRIPIQPDANNTNYGMGRLCTLKNRISIDEAVNLVKQRTNLKHVRLARAHGADGYINSVALCAGAGVTILKDASADLYLTGEMLHHDILDAVHRGIHVILTNHSDSERGFLKIFASILDCALQGSVKVCLSEMDRDPLQTV
ncbi:NIF3-like protein 1 isoform X2 [Cataglyphis hispanica]|uniref:NIF3-like protein 1 isoform X2 n=1 Tax=Cataglyphis hispanica TaxID=1086592 RepID=UPI002180115C|nr:NIF3-like protein 1 isoform X2 [Cataglyphis hispanica]XP_050454997.1 NIF3-like protein 1 isoform X2 [Cataglyphis hispanica]XP_050454998.1 NIF3-like protein 1 isoform X2 [Cataglyphis hispanica]